MSQTSDGLEHNQKPDRLLLTLERLLQIEAIEFNAILNEAAQLVEEVIVVGDAERLRQTLDNLLSNAVAHTDHERPIVVKLTKEQREKLWWAILTVNNTGPALSPDLVPRLFQSFVRGVHSKGMGLGLYLAHRIAVAHQGTLTLDTAAKGHVQFTLSLPLAVEYYTECEQEGEAPDESEGE